MDSQGPENRREERFPLEATAFIERETGERVPASTVNVSGSGVLVRLEAESQVRLGEFVTCGVNLYEKKPPQSWGTGRVVRIDRRLVAIDFRNQSTDGGAPDRKESPYSIRG